MAHIVRRKYKKNDFCSICGNSISFPVEFDLFATKDYNVKEILSETDFPEDVPVENLRYFAENIKLKCEVDKEGNLKINSIKSNGEEFTP